VSIYIKNVAKNNISNLCANTYANTNGNQSNLIGNFGKYLLIFRLKTLRFFFNSGNLKMHEVLDFTGFAKKKDFGKITEVPSWGTRIRTLK